MDLACRFVLPFVRQKEVDGAAALMPQGSDIPPAQIGEFYEAIGFDALLLCQFAKINPMATLPGVSRAGVPLRNMPRAVRALNAADLSVVRDSGQQS